MKKRLFTLALAGILSMSVLTGCGSFKGSETVATVDGTEVSADLANFFARYTQAQYETYYAAYMGEDMWNTESSTGENYETTIKASVLENVENMLILEKHMDEYDVEITEEDEAAIKKAAQTFDDKNGLEEKELVSGNTETVERALTLMTIKTKMDRAIKAKADLNVTDEEAAQKSMDYVFFTFQKTDDNNVTTFVSDDEMKELKTKAETIVAGLKEGKDFEELAADAGVEVSNIAFDSETTSPETKLIEAADQLEEGGVTDVIEGDNGYYVAKLTALLDREATDNRIAQIQEERQVALYNEVLEGWRDATEITENKKVWKKVSFQKVSVTMNTEEEEPYTESVTTDDQAK